MAWRARKEAELAAARPMQKQHGGGASAGGGAGDGGAATAGASRRERLGAAELSLAMHSSGKPAATVVCAGVQRAPGRSVASRACSFKKSRRSASRSAARCRPSSSCGSVKLAIAHALCAPARPYAA